MVSIYDGRSNGGYGDTVASPREVIAAFVSRWVRHLGALTSVALILGVVVWGYRLTERDISGLPVLHAPEGPARIAPDDPGGDLARHVGLAVNEVAASGFAAAGPNRVMLAPAPEELTSDDTAMRGVTSIAVVHRPEPATLEEALPANEPTANVPQSTAIAVDDDASGDVPDPVAVLAKPEQPYQISANAPDDRIPASVPGVKSSPRPEGRPFGEKAAAVETDAAPVPSAALSTKTDPAPAAATAPTELDAASVATGTRVVQLGAFESADVARSEWDRITRKFAMQMKGKQRLIQPSTSGGRTYYRLRVVGYKDLDDARSFCAALVAAKANCIPTVVQ